MYLVSTMKKNIVLVLIIALASLVFVSCSSSDVKFFSTAAPRSEKIAIQFNQGATSVTDTFYWYSEYDKHEHSYVYSESISLSNYENREKIRSGFMAKGYSVVQDSDADSIAIVENRSDSTYSRVSIAVYDKASQQLLYVCEGEYATLLLTAQFALDKALDQAISQIVPYVKY